MASILDENWAPETTDIASLLGMSLKEKCKVDSFWKDQEIIRVKGNDMYIDGYYAPLYGSIEHGIWLESMIGEHSIGCSFFNDVLNSWNVYHKPINCNHGLHGYGWCYSDFINLISTNRNHNEDCLGKALELFYHKNWNWNDEYNISEEKYVTYQERRKFMADDIVDYSVLCDWAKECNFRLGVCIQGNGQVPNKYKNIDCHFMDISWGHFWGTGDIISVPNKLLELCNVKVKNLCITAKRFEMRVPPILFNDCKIEKILVCAQPENIFDKMTWLFKRIPALKTVNVVYPMEYIQWALKFFPNEITQTLRELGNPEVEIFLRPHNISAPVLYKLTKMGDEYILKGV